MTFDELEKQLARPGDTAMVQVTRGKHGWHLTPKMVLSGQETLRGIEAHHYTPAPRVRVRRVIEVAREDVREGDFAVNAKGFV